MSIWNSVFDTEISQRTDIEWVKERLRHGRELSRTRTQQTVTRIRELEDELAEAALLLRSLYVYLKEQPGFDAQRFAAIVDQVDVSDGVKDGKLARPTRLTRLTRLTKSSKKRT